MNRLRVQDLRTDPKLVRVVLEKVEDGMSVKDAATTYGVSITQVYKWRNRRAVVGYDWPNDWDIAEWHRLAVERAASRARRRQQAESYRRRRYLNGSPLLVPAIGVIRRLRALQALGWTQKQLGEFTCVSTARIGHLSQGYRVDTKGGGHQVTTHVHIDTHQAIDQLYRKLCMTLPPDPDGWIAKRQKTWARRKGWAVPLMWDDIDDPSEHHTPRREDMPRKPARNPREVDMAIVYRVLNGEKLTTTKAERDEIMRRWKQAGKSAAALCRRMGWKDDRYGKAVGE